MIILISCLSFVITSVNSGLLHNFSFFLIRSGKILESVSYEFSGHGGVITYYYPGDEQPDTKVNIPFVLEIHQLFR